MRVSSSAPAMSRRSILRGLGLALIGASVPVAAIAGRTASKLSAGDDAELLNKCRDWEDRRRRLKRLEKELSRLYRDAKANTPPKPPELFEPFRLIDDPRFLWRPDDGGMGPSGYIPPDGSWARDRLELLVKARSSGMPSPECQAHCNKLLALLDAHEDAAERLLTDYRRLDRIWERENKKSRRLFSQIIRTRAATLQGAAAQLRLIELDGALSAYTDNEVRHWRLEGRP